MQRGRIDLVVGGVAAAVVGAMAARGGGAQLPPFLPVGDFASYDVTTSVALSAIEPIAHAPWLGTPNLGVVVALAVAVAIACWSMARWLGASVAAATIVLAAFVVRPEVHGMLAAGAPALAALAAVWGSALAAGRADPSWRTTLWSSVLLFAATTLWPPVVVLAPAIAVVWGGPRRGAALLVAAAIGAVVGAWRWTVAAAVISGDAVALAETWRVVAGLDPRGAQPYVWPPLVVTRVPIALMVAGLIVAAVRARTSRWRLAAACVAVLTFVPVPLAWQSELARAWFWAAWPLTALGVEWLASRAAGRGRAVVLVGVAAVLIGGGVSMRVRQIEAVEPRQFAAALQAILPGPGTTIVAEDPRLDSALVAYRGTTLERVRPEPGLIASRAAAGTPIWAGPSARAILELWGLRFARQASVERPAPFVFSQVAGRFRCVPVAMAWRELPGLEYTGRLGVHLPAGQGRFEAVVVGPPPGRAAMVMTTGQARGRAEPIAMDRRSLPSVLWPDGGAMPDPALSATRLTLDANADRPETAAVTLGSRAPLVAVRWVDDARSTGVATVCAAAWPRDDGLTRANTWALRLDDRVMFVAGWHGVESGGGQPFRWTTGQAVLLVPSSGPHGLTLRVEAYPAAADDGPPPTITAVVNGWPAGTRAMTGVSVHEWAVPSTIWVDGTNEIRLEFSRTSRPSDHGSHDTRELGARVTDIRLTAAP